MEAAAARKEGGESGGTGAAADDRRRDAVREAKKGIIIQRGASIPPLRPHATARGVLRRSGSGRELACRCGAYPNGGLRLWTETHPVAASRRGPGAAVQCGGMDGRAGRFRRLARYFSGGICFSLASDSQVKSSTMDVPLRAQLEVGLARHVVPFGPDQPDEHGLDSRLGRALARVFTVGTEEGATGGAMFGRRWPPRSSLRRGAARKRSMQPLEPAKAQATTSVLQFRVRNG